MCVNIVADREHCVLLQEVNIYITTNKNGNFELLK